VIKVLDEVKAPQTRAISQGGEGTNIPLNIAGRIRWLAHDRDIWKKYSSDLVRYSDDIKKAHRVAIEGLNKRINNQADSINFLKDKLDEVTKYWETQAETIANLMDTKADLEKRLSEARKLADTYYKLLCKEATEKQRRMIEG
jgi:chromosome segregation ATPase